MHGLHLLITRCEKSSFHGSVVDVGVTLNNHVDEDGSLPVATIIVAMHLTERTHERASLLACLTSVVNDRQAAHLTSITVVLLQLLPAF